MAQGFFSRLGNLWKGFLSIWVSDVERNNPEIAYENAINSMVEKYSGLKRATASIIRRREDLEARHAAQSKELAQTTLDLNVAVETNQDDLALVLIQKKNQLESDVTELQGEMEAAVKDADTAKQSLMQVQTEIKKLRAEKDAMLARLQSAQARIRIQEQLEGLSVESEVKALENVREHIKTTVAQANLDKELAETSLEKRLAGLRAQSGEVAARQQLEQLKAAAATKALGQKKTM
ncbi:MAG: PspA/IM30 family protein [Polyangiaceae bacterium]